MTTDQSLRQPSDDELRAMTMQIVGSYQALLAEKRWDEWTELWAEDGELCFPFAPLGRKNVYCGHREIRDYMSEAGRVVVDSLVTGQLSSMEDPRIAVAEFTVKGHAAASGAPFGQSYVMFFETKGGKLWRCREYWNPLVTIDALGGRGTWTDGFGSPDPTRDAWGREVDHP